MAIDVIGVRYNICVLRGEVLRSVDVSGYKDSPDIDSTPSIVFTTEGGREYTMYHPTDCCEEVYIEDICGDVVDLVGCEILYAQELTSGPGENGVNLRDPLHEEDSSFTWTFYSIRTIKGTVDIRWYGVSNGYYSEAVDFVLSAILPPQKAANIIPKLGRTKREIEI